MVRFRLNHLLHRNDQCLKKCPTASNQDRPVRGMAVSAVLGARSRTSLVRGWSEGLLTCFFILATMDCFLNLKNIRSWEPWQFQKVRCQDPEIINCLVTSVTNNSFGGRNAWGAEASIWSPGVVISTRGGSSAAWIGERIVGGIQWRLDWRIPSASWNGKLCLLVTDVLSLVPKICAAFIYITLSTKYTYDTLPKKAA